MCEMRGQTVSLSPHFSVIVEAEANVFLGRTNGVMFTVATGPVGTPLVKVCAGQGFIPVRQIPRRGY